MRSFFIAIALVAICSCGGVPYFDLRHPIYMVTEQSFWSGCEQDPTGYEACRASRVQQINDGVKQWFDYFGKANHPRAVILYSKNNLPSNRVNEDVIYLKIEAGFCGEGSFACYAYGASSSSYSSPEIVFDNSFTITPRRMAHEFGHVLGRDDNDVPEGTGSVMSYKLPTVVTPLDIEMMCRLHHECRMVKRK
ncbi:MAG: hypothetical protein G01um101413_737 [Parcubacteria group bacterium Gr01-1014_13]|nr:MAG: hypothetical protein G01um101413_737 [Parcubacteria group bacterium Gr01-1014_13]